jgi:hypothetical protein
MKENPCMSEFSAGWPLSFVYKNKQVAIKRLLGIIFAVTRGSVRNTLLPVLLAQRRA